MAVLWSDLPDHLWCLVLKKFDVIDFCRFSVVCSNWRLLADSNRDLLSCTPWLMLPHFNEVTKKSSFLRLTDRSLFQIRLPEAVKKRVCGCSHGWLITFDSRPSLHLLNPLNPFTRVQIPLPRRETLRNAPCRINQRILHSRFIQRAVLSSDPNWSTDYVVMAICSDMSFLVMWRAGEECWTALDQSRQPYEDVAFWRGRFYALTCAGMLLVCDLIASPPTAKEINVPPPGSDDDDEGSGDTDALIVNDNEYRGWMTFCAFELDQVNGKWIALKDLGESMLFLSDCASNPFKRRHSILSG